MNKKNSEPVVKVSDLKQFIEVNERLSFLLQQNCEYLDKLSGHFYHLLHHLLLKVEEIEENAKTNDNL